MDVKLYTQKGCPQCNMVKMILDKNKIPYEKFDDVEEMLKIGISHTPTLSVDGELFVGKALMDKIRTLGK